VLMTEHWLTASPELKVLIGDVDRAADLYAAGWTLRRIAGSLTSTAARSACGTSPVASRCRTPEVASRAAVLRSRPPGLHWSRRLEGIAYSASGRLSEVFEFAERAFSSKLS
jgi:hypothetical protein